MDINMGKAEKDDICPIKIISFDSDVSKPAKQGDTMKLDIIKQLIKYTNTTDKVDITFENVPTQIKNEPLKKSLENKYDIKIHNLKEPVVGNSNFDDLYSDLEYLDEFEPVVQTFIEKPASISRLDKNEKMDTCLETNTAQTDTDFSGNTTDDEDSIMEYLGQGLSLNQVNQMSYIDSVIKGLSEKHKKQRILNSSVLQTKCDFFCKKIKETNHKKVFPRQITTYLFKKITDNCATAEWKRKDYDQFGNVINAMGNTEVLKKVEWDTCRKILDKRKKEIVTAPATTNDAKPLTTRCTLLLKADNEKDDRYLAVFDTRNNSVFHLKIEEAIENTNAVNITNPYSKDVNNLYDPDGKKRKYMTKREISNYIVKMKMIDKGYLCTVCKKLFAHKKNYISHMRRHFVKKKTELRKSSDTNGSGNQTHENHLKPYSTHKKVQRSRKPFMCDECGRSVKRLDTFRNHLMSHAGVKPHSCHICEKRFLQKHSLKAHQLVHSGEKPYLCSICPERYRKIELLRDHLRLAHTIIHPKKNQSRSGEDGNANEEMDQLTYRTEELVSKPDD